MINPEETPQRATYNSLCCDPPLAARQKDKPELGALVKEMIGRVADKWTMLALEVLAEHGTLRFTQLGELISGVSHKMLTKTLRQMEADGLVRRTAYPVVPPKVEYTLTGLGLSLGAAFFTASGSRLRGTKPS